MAILPFDLPEYTADTQIYGIVKIPVCTKSDWDFLLYALSANSQQLCYRALCRLGIKYIPEHAPVVITKRILEGYKQFIDDYCSANLDIFEIPEKPDFDGELDGKLKATIVTFGQWYIKNHTGLNFNEIQNLNILEYNLLLADAVKLKMLSRADGKGKEYLNECYDAMHHISTMFD